MLTRQICKQWLLDEYSKMIACWWYENNLWNYNHAISLNDYNK